jgi:hypothetical protein
MTSARKCPPTITTTGMGGGLQPPVAAAAVLTAIHFCQLQHWDQVGLGASAGGVLVSVIVGVGVVPEIVVSHGSTPHAVLVVHVSGQLGGALRRSSPELSVPCQPELSQAGSAIHSRSASSHASADLAWFDSRPGTWAKAESLPTVTCVFPDGRAGLPSSP